MSSDIWEQAVETYLTIDRGLFVNPQYLIGEPGEWEANPDFLAISFRDSVVWMVEVTKSPRGKINGKIKSFEQDYVPRIKDQLRKHRVIRGDDTWAEWTVGLWVFAPRETLPGLETRIQSAALQKFLLTSLEETLPPNWEARFH